MKSLIVVLLFFISQSILAEIFRFELDAKSKTIEILEVDKIHVSKSCFDSKKECLNFISKSVEKLKSKKDSSKKQTFGHPASQFCQKLDGNSVIVFDKENNQYDLCLINNLYYIDSWDLFNQIKK